MNLENEVYKTALLLVEHFSNSINREENGFKSTGRHSRIFQYILHPEIYFVGYGKTKETVTENIRVHPEHVVPCAVLISECMRLIKSGMSKDKIATLLTKHWKIVYITKEQAKLLDTKTNNTYFKHTMPKDWKFEDGDTFARLKLAKIIQDESELLPLN